jgi:hypothetical protein
MIVCARCKNRNPDGVKSCRFCGATLPAAKWEASGPVEQAPLVEQESLKDAPVKPPSEETGKPLVEAAEKSETTRPDTPFKPETAEGTVRKPIIPVDPKPDTSIQPPGQPPPGSPVTSAPTRKPLSWIVMALLAAGTGGGGYFTGYYSEIGAKRSLAELDEKFRAQQVRLEQTEAKLKEQIAQMSREHGQTDGINAQVAAKDAEIKKLKDQLTALQSKLAVEVKARETATRQLEVAQTQSGRESADRQRQLTQTKQNFEALQERLKQTEARLAAATADLAKARERPPAAARQPKTGVLIWVGDVKHNKNVEFRDGKLHGGGSLSGSLPGIPVTMQVEDSAHVSISVAPGTDNNWSRISFKVRGEGATTVRLFWTAR